MRPASRDATTWLKPRRRVNYPPLVALLLTVGVVVGGLVSGQLGWWIFGGLVAAVILFLFAAILSGFVTEISKIFRR